MTFTDPAGNTVTLSAGSWQAAAFIAAPEDENVCDACGQLLEGLAWSLITQGSEPNGSWCTRCAVSLPEGVKL